MPQTRSHPFKKKKTKPTKTKSQKTRSDFNSENDAMSLCLGSRNKTGPDTSKRTVPGDIDNYEPEQILKGAVW